MTAQGVIAIGCSSGSSGGGAAPAATDAGGGAAAPAPPQTQQPPPPPPPPQGGGGGGGGAPPPPPAGLDGQLQAALANAGVTPPTAPAADSAALVTLGEALFFDKLLSGNRNISCATCHHPDLATGDGLPLPLGEGATGLGPARAGSTDQVIPRNAPHVFNAGLPQVPSMFWDGRLSFDPATGVFETPEPGLNGATPALAAIVAELDGPLAAQALFPVTSPAEMRGEPGDNELADAADNAEVWELLMARLVGTAGGTVGGFADYRALFAAAFPAVTNPDDLNFGHAARAIAAFERATFSFLDSPLDQYLAGDLTALSDPAKRGGLVFFGAARCGACHSGPLLSDFDFHAIATPQLGPGKDASDDTGRVLITGANRDTYRFRTPPLRNVDLTGPFMHSGAFTTLDEVLTHYRNPTNSQRTFTGASLPPFFQALVDFDTTRQEARIARLSPRLTPPPNFTNVQRQELLAFLAALTDDAARTLPAPPATVPSGLPVAD